MFGFLHDCLESNVKAALAKEADFRIDAARERQEASYSEQLSRIGDNLSAVTKYIYDNYPELLEELAEEFRSYANVGGQVFVSTHSRLAGSIVEAWYWGDLQAVGKAYNKDLSKIGRKRMYKMPDDIISPKRELQKKNVE